MRIFCFMSEKVPAIIKDIWKKKLSLQEREDDIMDKRLYKSDVNRTIAGVCGGIGEYFNIDPTLIRLAWIIFCFAGGSGILAYIIAAVIIPRRPAFFDEERSY